MDNEIRTTADIVGDLLSLLDEYEWSHIATYRNELYYNNCLYCGNNQEQGHTNECTFVKTYKEAEAFVAVERKLEAENY